MPILDWSNCNGLSVGGHTPKACRSPRTRKTRNIAGFPKVVIGTEKADEAVILEGTAKVITDRKVWKQLAKVHDSKYGGDVEPLLMASDGSVFRVAPRVVFAQDEHAENFADAVTRCQFDEA